MKKVERIDSPLKCLSGNLCCRCCEILLPDLFEQVVHQYGDDCDSDAADPQLNVCECENHVVVRAEDVVQSKASGDDCDDLKCCHSEQVCFDVFHD